MIMYDQLQSNPLFRGMNLAEIQHCLQCSNAITKQVHKNQIIFSQEEPPRALFVLLQGSVVVCKDSVDGKRYIVTTIEENDIFGEVFVFLEAEEYSYYVVASEDSTILEIPKEYFYHRCAKNCDHHSKITYNLLSILAHKAHFLNSKVQLLASVSLRQKLIRYLLSLPKENNVIILPWNREELADYLNVARPSLSRELMKLVKEQLIDVQQNEITFIDIETLETYL